MSEHLPNRMRSRAWRAVAAATFGIAVLGACSSDGQPALPDDVALPEGGGAEDGGGGEEPAAPEPEPAPEPPPEPEPAPEPAPDQGGDSASSTTSTDDEAWTTEEWVLLVLLGVAVVAVIIGATSAATSHSEKKRQQQSKLRQQLSSVVGGTRWVLDQGSMAVLRADPQQTQNAWNSVRPQVVNLEGTIARCAGDMDDSSLDGSMSRLGQDVAGLRGALDAYASTAAGGQSDLVERAQQTVISRCQQVETSLQPIVAAQP